VLQVQLAATAVEIRHLAGAHVCRPNREARLSFADEIEVDELGESGFERSCRIVAGVICAQRVDVAGMGERIGREEAWYAAHQGRPVGPFIAESRQDTAKVQPRGLLHPAPEFAQSRQAVLRRVSSDEAGVDGSNRRTDDPVRLDASFLQRLVHACLIGSQRAAALQHEHDLTRKADLVRCTAL
jgi:hypothetical protein